MSRPVTAEIHTAALRHNLQRVRQLAPQTKVMAVIKADAYGHGLISVARALSAADGFGVAELDEAVALREVGVDKPICLLTGFHHPAELPEVSHYALNPVLHSPVQVAALLRAELPQALTVWVKVDSGMHRIGFAPANLQSILQQLNAAPQVKEVRLMSHLANADDPNDAYTQRQLEIFQNCAAAPLPVCSVANSAAVVAWPDTHFDWVRPGIMLYGASPVKNQSAHALDLQPVMQFNSQLIAVRNLQRGDAVGYGGTFHCPQDMPVGVVACGYGDGYPRHAKGGTPVWVSGHEVPLIGRVSMDMLTVDLRQHPGAQVGDPVQLWGGQVDVDRVAGAAETIAYELFCGVTARVPRRVVE